MGTTVFLLLWFSNFCSIQFSCSVVSDSLLPHGLQHARIPCPSPTPGACSNSCPLSWWCHSTISSSVVPFSSCLQSFPASGSFPTSQFFPSGGRWSFSFSISPSSEYSGLISFRTDLFYFLAFQGALKSLVQHISSKAATLWCLAFLMVQLSHPYTTTGKSIALPWTPHEQNSMKRHFFAQGLSLLQQERQVDCPEMFPEAQITREWTNDSKSSLLLTGGTGF